MVSVGRVRHPAAGLEGVVTEAHDTFRFQYELAAQGDIPCNELLDGLRVGSRFGPGNHELGIRRVESCDAGRVSRVVGFLPCLTDLRDLGTNVPATLRVCRDR